ncbi:MAG: sensor histidine kinase [Candidatus Midichloriaceae bacterium]|nr:sensor histidine kinase [Candidatus Midichloriaceae bacterium]
MAREYIIKYFINAPLLGLSLELKEVYTKSIWNRYYPVLHYIKSQPTSEWGSLYQYQSFQLASGEYLDTESLIKATVFNPEGKVLFDSDDDISIAHKDLLIQKTMSSDGKGDSQYFMDIDEITVSADNGEKIKKNVLVIALPLNVTVELDEVKKQEAERGVLEFVYDIDHRHNILLLGQYLFILIIVIVIIPVALLVVISSRKVEELIDKQQEAALELANAKVIAESESRAKSQFLANISHELRTPLNAIIGFSELINSESMGPLNNDKYKEFVHDIKASGVHLLSLINDILDFSKADENKLQINLEEVDLTKTIKICLRMMAPRSQEAGVTLIDEVPAEHIIILADNKRTKQVMLNLLSNAVKFTPEGGKVVVKVWKNLDNNSVVMQIKDSGIGMAAQDLARALSPFGQIENKLSKRFEGTGLGLPLSKKLVELMNGSFEIQSESNIGTTVTIVFSLQSGDIEDSEEGLT